MELQKEKAQDGAGWLKLILKQQFQSLLGCSSIYITYFLVFGYIFL